MRITESQLRRIVRQEILREAAVRSTVTPDGMTLSVQTTEAPAGFFSYLRVQGHTEDIAGVTPSRGSMGAPTTVTSNPRATFGVSEEDSLRLLRKNISSEIRRLERNADLRPSQARRLDLLRQGMELV